MTFTMQPAKTAVARRRIAFLTREFVSSPREFVRKARAKVSRIRREVLDNSVPARVVEYLPSLAWREVEITRGDPVLNVLMPNLQRKQLSGGPNTALNLTYHLAAAGVPVRLVSTDSPPDNSRDLLRHCAELTGIRERPANITVAAAGARRHRASVGRNDMLLATHWPTAHYAHSVMSEISSSEFIYMIQDYEPGFYQWSTHYALAMETYGMSMRPVICSSLLAEYLLQERVGRFAESEFADSCLVFEPAVDRSRFYMDSERDQGAPRRLLFYGRPWAPRNLFELGLIALRQAVDRGAITSGEWELWFIGGGASLRDLGREVVIKQHPWLDYDRYAALLRSCDVGLSLMLSPHTSYPPLEMAACGASVVTNTFANKTAERLRRISQNLVPAEPTVDSIAAALLEALSRAPDFEARRRGSALCAPATWDEAFKPVIPPLVRMWNEHVAGAGARDGVT